MSDLKENIIGLTLGIKFNKSFRIPDISGDVIDHVLYSEETPFGTKFFPKVQENSAREKTLFNPDTSDYLRINTDDFILGVTVEDNFDEKYNWLKNDVLSYFQDDLFRSHKIKNIQRIGIIFHHKIGKTRKLTDAIAVFSEDEVSNADNINISFSQKAPANEALYRKGVNDYKNTIYSFRELKGSVYAELDYQYYYDPAIEDSRECSSIKVLNDARSFLEGKYHAWLIKYESEKSK